MPGTTVVLLSQVPAELREEMAYRAAKRWGLKGPAFVELLLIARMGRPDAVLEVSVEKAEQVLVRGKFPKGQIPRFG